MASSRNKQLAVVGAILLMLGASLAVIRWTPGHLGTGLFGGGPGTERSSLASALAKAGLGADFLAMIGQRSPGQRVAGELADTKGRKLASAAPHQRALSKVRAPAPLPESFVKPLFESQPTAPVAAVALPPLAELLPQSFAQTAPGGLGYAPPGGGGGIVSPPLIGSPLSPPGIVPPPVTTAAVPEPQTWLMMLIGFGAAGTAMRRRRTLETQPARAVLRR